MYVIAMPKQGNELEKLNFNKSPLGEKEWSLIDSNAILAQM